MPAWLFTPATSSCRSTSWPSCTTSRSSSDTRTSSFPPQVPSDSDFLSAFSRARTGDRFQPCRGRTSLLLLLLSNSLAKVKALNIVFEVTLDDLFPWDCFIQSEQRWARRQRPKKRVCSVSFTCFYF
ncbi:hypothetical protein F7725_008641 [Dissostichus mawsoni]|uniref:Uncharacterized protein n=1 Tax=Dissostichus mawsoni TaxID=36200 RepID=A0A7J5YAW7_DISMA|nr:hypothetical protein F7725_008641 [Dissostichus mawsoni]